METWTFKLGREVVTIFLSNYITRDMSGCSFSLIRFMNLRALKVRNV